ncbi:MAG: Ig-like domain-containing protein [Flavobacteriaceae bacterium]|nr:Ig-like domain-containing protein [Flavobacteriaceae bacterium]
MTFLRVYFRIFFILLVLIFIISSCARRGRPEGGPKDESKPIMVKTDPAFKSIHFDKDEIRIYFDEFIKLKDITSQLIVSPPLKYPPVISPQGTPSKRITIKIKDTLQENTTYTFNFGQSIIDNTEGNVLDNFKYIFSTGDYIDSLEVSGTIKDAFDFKMIENPTLMLYPIVENFNDSIIYNEKPMYVGSTLDSVNWNISNIKAGKYLLVALNDNSKNYKFNPKEDKIGFHSTYISVPTDSTYNISLFDEILPFNLPTKPKEVAKGHMIFGYEGDASNFKVKPLSETADEFKSIITFDQQKDTLHYWFKNYEKDSILMTTIKNRVLDTVKIKLRAEEIDSLKIGASTKGTLHLRDTLKIASSVPMIKVDTAKIYFMDKDSVQVPYQLVFSKNKNRLIFDFEKKEKNKYKLTLFPGAITDFYGVQNDTLNVNFTTKTTTNYSSLFLKINNIKSYPIIIHLINEKGKVVEKKYADKAREYQFENLLPSRYKVRIIYDTNKNKKWDTGNFLLKQQPEEVYYFKNIINIKANWEMTEIFTVD